MLEVRRTSTLLQGPSCLTIRSLGLRESHWTHLQVLIAHLGFVLGSPGPLSATQLVLVPGLLLQLVQPVAAPPRVLLLPLALAMAFVLGLPITILKTMSLFRLELPMIRPK